MENSIQKIATDFDEFKNTEKKNKLAVVVDDEKKKEQFKFLGKSTVCLERKKQNILSRYEYIWCASPARSTSDYFAVVVFGHCIVDAGFVYFNIDLIYSAAS